MLMGHRTRTRGKPIEQKRKEAAERQAERDTRTDAEQLAKLDREGWRAEKERARLQP
jgi:hypothetical protein